MLAAEFYYFRKLNLPLTRRPRRNNQILLRADDHNIFEHRQVPGVGNFLRFIHNIIIRRLLLAIRAPYSFYLGRSFSIKILYANWLGFFPLLILLFRIC